MSRLHQLCALGAGIALFFVPLSVAHAQVYSYGDGYADGYNSYPSGTYYPNSPNIQSYPSNSYYYPSYSAQSPTCTISITTPNTYSGSAVTGTLTWTSANAYSAYLTTLGSVNPFGSTSVYAYPYEVFTLTVTGPGGTNDCQTEYYPTGQQYYQPYSPYSGYTYPSYTYPTYPTNYYSNYQYSYSYGTPEYTTPVYVAPTYMNYNPVNYIKTWWNKMRW